MMFQKFYTDTLGSRYIKSLLAQTPLPIFQSVVEGDLIIQGCYYVYKNYIIKCNTSGVLQVDKSENLYPSENLFPSVFLFPGFGIRSATFYVKSLVSDYLPKTHFKYVSKTNYYDSETHYHLGRYLRYVLTTTGLNLFPYYNCYNSKYLKDVELFSESLHNVGIRRSLTSLKKVVAIPILFGHTYTIAIDCPTEVLLRAAIYDNSGYVDESKLPESLLTSINDSGRIFSSLSFNNPVEFRIEIDTIEAAMLERNLYLIIQLPQSNDSSIVVLENYKDFSGVQCDKDSVRTYQGVVNPSLLHVNTKQSYAFSDRLIEYLVKNVVHKDDEISQNIAECQALISSLDSNYRSMFFNKLHTKGVWDKNLSKHVYCICEEYAKKHNVYDQDGNFNKDVIKILYEKGAAV